MWRYCSMFDILSEVWDWITSPWRPDPPIVPERPQPPQDPIVPQEGIPPNTTG